MDKGFCVRCRRSRRLELDVGTGGNFIPATQSPSEYQIAPTSGGIWPHVIFIARVVCWVAKEQSQ